LLIDLYEVMCVYVYRLLFMYQQIYFLRLHLRWYTKTAHVVETRYTHKLTSNSLLSRAGRYLPARGTTHTHTHTHTHRLWYATITLTTFVSTSTVEPYL